MSSLEIRHIMGRISDLTYSLQCAINRRATAGEVLDITLDIKNHLDLLLGTCIKEEQPSR